MTAYFHYHLYCLAITDNAGDNKLVQLKKTNNTLKTSKSLKSLSIDVN